MENSLAVLQTSYFDLFQFHAVTTEDDVDKILMEGGALEAIKLARSQGSKPTHAVYRWLWSAASMARHRYLTRHDIV